TDHLLFPDWTTFYTLPTVKRWWVVLFLSGMASAGGVDFARQVEPLLRTRCYSCHGQAVQSKGLRLDLPESARRVIVPGKSLASPLVMRIEGRAQPAMPPTGEKLNEREVQLVRDWIDQGAAWPAGSVISPAWAFERVRKPSPPVVRNRAWPRNPIDA